MQFVDSAYPDGGVFSPGILRGEFSKAFARSTVRQKLLSDLQKQPEPSKSELWKYLRTTTKMMQGLRSMRRTSEKLGPEEREAACLEVFGRQKQGEKVEFAVANVAELYDVSLSTIWSLLRKRRKTREAHRAARRKKRA
ncbi:MAG TPA: hypothetical protein VMV59_00865 [Candidatus Dormibacteraeota bacterium]|nr:hypothetical protein [Candidatus Dormibacteraeota bacterium]